MVASGRVPATLVSWNYESEVLWVSLIAVVEHAGQTGAVTETKLGDLMLRHLLNKVNTSPGEGLRITRPGGGGAYSAPPAISAPRNARNTKLGGWVGPHKNSLWCKFGDPRSTSSRSNDVINAKFSHFLVKRAALCFSRSRAQTKTDSFDLQKREDAQWIGLSGVSRQIWPQVNRLGARGQSSPGSSTIFRTLRFSSITSEVLVLEQ